jgi:flagellar protein FlaJ
MLRKYANFCYYQVGEYVLDYTEYFEGLNPQLSKADIEVSLPEYLSMILMTTLVVSIGSLTVLGSILTLTSGISGFISSIIFTTILTAIVPVTFYIIPSVLINSRASQIEDTLPFATMYLSTLAGTGTSLPEIFKNLSKVEQYGEVSKEAQKITKDIETFGMDINEALKRAAERTPSEDFEELLWGLNHIITTGGDMREFLKQESEQLMKDYKRRVEEFSETLGLIVEMYITLVVVGSILFTSMSVVMGAFSSMPPNAIVWIQVLAIMVVLPFITVAVIFLIKNISPGGIQ